MELRFCTDKEVPLVMDFIKNYWSNTHILSRNRNLFDWQHKNKRTGLYDFAIAVNNGEIYGCLGVIRNSRYDIQLVNDDTVWLTTWKVRDDAPAGLGLQLHSFVSKNLSYSWIGTVGNNSVVTSIYKALGYKTGMMKQFATINPEIQNFQIIKLPGDTRHSSTQLIGAPSITLNYIERNTFDSIKPSTVPWLWDQFPVKSLAYFKSRYLEHPYYEYKIYSVEQNNVVFGLLVTRICEANNARVLRIVDVRLRANLRGNLATALQQLLIKNGCECVDVYQIDGSQGASFEDLGFFVVNSNCFLKSK